MEGSASLQSEESSTSGRIDVNQALYDSIINRIMSAGVVRNGTTFSAPDVNVSIRAEEIIKVCQNAANEFLKQKSLLRLNLSRPIFVVGDLHGQLRDLRLILSRLGDPAANHAYLFLGDYVDRGTQGIELVLLLFCLRLKHPNSVFLLRGNHEDINTSSVYGCYDECIKKYGRQQAKVVWMNMCNSFNSLPISALVNEKVFCMHGGLSPYLNTLKDIEKIVRPSIIPSHGLMCDLLWSDPVDTKVSTSGWSLSQRGISFSFESSVVDKFCEKNNVDVIVRAHQINTEMFRCGYKIMHAGRLITLFSAPNYQNMRNDAAVLQIDPQMEFTFLVQISLIFGCLGCGILFILVCGYCFPLLEGFYLTIRDKIRKMKNTTGIAGQQTQRCSIEITEDEMQQEARLFARFHPGAEHRGMCRHCDQTKVARARGLYDCETGSHKNNSHTLPKSQHYIHPRHPLFINTSDIMPI